MGRTIKDPDAFLQSALQMFHNAQWHRSALMFRDLSNHLRNGGDLPYDWRWKIEGDWSSRHRADVIEARKVGVLIGMTGAHYHSGACVDAMGPRLKCEELNHGAPDCVEPDCKVKASFISDDRPRCDAHYREYTSRVSKIMGYGGKSGSRTGD